MRSTEVVARTGATYRQIDYWTRMCLFSAGRVGGGSGSRREFDDPEVVLVRALVLISRLSHPAYRRFVDVLPQLREAWEGDPELRGYWLVMTADVVLVVHHSRDAVPLDVAVLMVDLGACAEVVTGYTSLAG